MKNLRSLNTCSNCRHVFEENDYDDPSQFYCNKDKDRDEYYTKSLAGIYTKEFEAWQDWENTHRVETYKVCDDWEEEE